MNLLIKNVIYWSKSFAERILIIEKSLKKIKYKINSVGIGL